MAKKPLIPVELEEGLAEAVKEVEDQQADAGQGAKAKFSLDGLEDNPVKISKNLMKSVRHEAAEAGFRDSRPKKFGRPSVGRTAQITLKVRPEFAQLLDALRDETMLGFNVMVEQAICEKYGYDFRSLKRVMDIGGASITPVYKGPLAE